MMCFYSNKWFIWICRFSGVVVLVSLDYVWKGHKYIYVCVFLIKMIHTVNVPFLFCFSEFGLRK